MRKNDSFTYFNFLILCMWLKVINKVKVTHQGQSKISSSFPIYVKFYLFKHINPVCGYRSLIRSRSHIEVKVISRSK